MIFFQSAIQVKINYFHDAKNSEIADDSDEIPFFPNSFLKTCVNLTNFTPLIPYDVFGNMWLLSSV